MDPGEMKFTLSFVQGGIGPRGDPGRAGPPGPPVSTSNDPTHGLLSTAFILFHSL